MASLAGGIVLVAATGLIPAGAQEFQLNWGHYLPNGPFVEVEQGFAGGYINIAELVARRTEGFRFFAGLQYHKFICAACRVVVADFQVELHHRTSDNGGGQGQLQLLSR